MGKPLLSMYLIFCDSSYSATTPSTNSGGTGDRKRRSVLDLSSDSISRCVNSLGCLFEPYVSRLIYGMANVILRRLTQTNRDAFSRFTFRDDAHSSCVPCVASPRRQKRALPIRLRSGS